MVIMDYINAKVFINTTTFFYKVCKEQQVVTFTAVKSVLFLIMPPSFFASQSSIAEEILSSAPTVSNVPYVVFAL